MLVDDHAPVRQSIRQLIELAGGYEIVGEAGDGSEAVAEVDRTKPDVVLLDVNMPGMSGVDATREIKATHPEVKILALSALGDLSHVSSMVKAGADGYLMKGGSSEELLGSINAVYRGEGPVDREVTVDVIRSFADLEDQLRQAQKMESLGQLVSGVAHDFNNVVSVISNYARFIEEDLDESDPKRDDVAEILRASQRAEGLIQQLMTFSRKEEPRPVVLDVNTAIRQIAGLWSRVLGADIHIDLALESGAWQVRMDPTHLDQVIMNLAVNARDALPRGGHLTIRTENVSVGHQLSQHHPGVTPKDYVRITVEDDGEGMPKEVADRIFEPFFTTKPRDRGTGLGLATVHGIVKQALGSIQVDTEPGRGTAFHIYLPAAETAVEAGPPAGPDRQGEGELVLVVEEDEAVGRLVKRLLTSGGYEVVWERDGAAAVAWARDSESPIDAVVLDATLTGMPAPEVVARVTELYPDAGTVYLAASTGEVLGTRDGRPVSDLLAKPFSKTELFDRLRSAIGSRPRR